jgi:hypothetical protein
MRSEFIDALVNVVVQYIGGENDSSYFNAGYKCRAIL